MRTIGLFGSLARPLFSVTLRSLLLYAVAGIVLALAVCFALIATLVLLAPHIGPVWSALAIAIALLVMASGCMLAGSKLFRRAKAQAKRAATVPLIAFNYAAVLGTSIRQPAVLGLGALVVGTSAFVRRMYRVWSRPKTGISRGA